MRSRLKSAHLLALAVSGAIGLAAATAAPADAWSGPCAPAQGDSQNGRYRVFYERTDPQNHAFKDPNAKQAAIKAALVTWVCVDRDDTTGELRVALQIHTRRSTRGFSEPDPRITDCRMLYSVTITAPKHATQKLRNYLDCAPAGERLLVANTNLMLQRVPLDAEITVQYQPTVSLYYRSQSQRWYRWPATQRRFPAH